MTRRGRETGTPTCVYRVDAGLLELLDRVLGPPLDSYVRGWQVWLEPTGPGREVLEWRLHPPAGFRMPDGCDHRDLYDEVLQHLDEPAITVGTERRSLAEIWEVLEVFPAYGDDVDPTELAGAVASVLDGRAPDAHGRVDHDRLGDAWKGRRGDFSVGGALLESLSDRERGGEVG